MVSRRPVANAVARGLQVLSVVTRSWFFLTIRLCQAIISFVVVAVLVVVGVVVGVILSKKKSSSISASSVPSGTNPSDPSNFPKNSALQQSFWGIAYTPLGSLLPDCGNSLGERTRAVAFAWS